MKFINEFTYSVEAMVLLPIVRKALDGVQELKITMPYHKFPHFIKSTAIAAHKELEFTVDNS